MRAMARGILVFAEVVRDELSRGSKEALALGRTLADAQNGELGAVLLAGDAALAAEAITYGADAAYLLTSPLPAVYQPESYADLGEQICEALAPKIILLPHSPLGCDLAPRLSFRLELPWAAGCLGMEIVGGQVLLSRPFVGGKVLLEEASRPVPGEENARRSRSGKLLLEEGAAFPLLATLRARCVEPLPHDAARAGEVRHLSLTLRGESQRLRAIAHVTSEGGATEELAEAVAIVSGGLGMGSEEGFARLAELAKLLGASIGASKAAVDRGWVAPERQVGLTGTTVAPRLYLAVGISGSAAHMAGCAKSKTIVAVNKDPEANIFRFAKYGIVAEWEEVLPLLLARLGTAKAAV